MITAIALIGIVGVIGVLGGLPIYYGRPIIFQTKALLLLVAFFSVAIADTANLFLGVVIGVALIIVILWLRLWLILRTTKDKLTHALENAMSGVRADFKNLGAGTFSFQENGRIRILSFKKLALVTFALKTSKRARLVQIIFRKFVKSFSIK